MACCLGHTMNKRLFMGISIILVILVMILILSGIIYYRQYKEEVEIVATVYAEENCGCCLGYIDYLKSKGVIVNITYVDEEKLADIKKQLGIPPNLYSCHTSIVQGYVIEGHVPFHIITKLVKEKPNILGIALPGMPPGSPGMQGELKEPLTIYAFTKDTIYLYEQTMQTN